MGASDSKHTDESQQLNSTGHHSEEDNRTPPVNKRLMKLTDPRSPTDGVDRTPIVTEKPKSGSGDLQHATPLRIDTSATPEPDDQPHDPRSPSGNVSRTPQPFTFTDPRSPSGNVARTPFIRHVDDATDPRSPTTGVERTPFVNKEGEKGEPTNTTSSSFECLVDDQPSPSVQENLNSSNSNIELEEDPLQIEDTGNESQKLIKKHSDSGLTQIDTPQYEAELTRMVEKQSLVTVYCEPEEASSQEEDDEPGLITTTGASKKPKKNKKSLKDKMQQKLHGGAPRSPLSTRNLLSDSPASLQLRSGSNSVTYIDKASARRRHTVATPTRLVGRYEPIVDKENV